MSCALSASLPAASSCTRPRDADASGFGQRFQPCGDVDDITEKVAPLDNDITLMDASAQRCAPEAAGQFPQPGGARPAPKRFPTCQCGARGFVRTMKAQRISLLDLERHSRERRPTSPSWLHGADQVTPRAGQPDPSRLAAHRSRASLPT